MTRPLPRCATCGASLARANRILLKFLEVPGRPSVGWCGEHIDYGIAIGRLDDDPIPRLLVIAARGPGRVVGGPAWERRVQAAPLADYGRCPCGEPRHTSAGECPVCGLAWGRGKP